MLVNSDICVAKQLHVKTNYLHNFEKQISCLAQLLCHHVFVSIWHVTVILISGKLRRLCTAM